MVSFSLRLYLTDAFICAFLFIGYYNTFRQKKKKKNSHLLNPFVFLVDLETVETSVSFTARNMAQVSLPCTVFD